MSADQLLRRWTSRGDVPRRTHPDWIRLVLVKTEDGRLWGRKCWACDEWLNEPVHESREDVPEAPRGNRKGQLRYYLRAVRYEPWGRKWNRFWASRWFWSAGRLGPVPVMYSSHYWDRSDER